ncbi:GH15469 [Drosophila grimshawi]|uniref:GH15469 n=1 Tax=Drosophila grimshawi TaxID=7222 RepID=B4J2C0_DROGR|nr:GH15469 [Drosophila grimshawi]
MIFALLCSRVREGSNQRQSQYSTKTTSSSVANLSLQEKSSVERPLVSTVPDKHSAVPQQQQLQQQRPPKHIFKLELD